MRKVLMALLLALGLLLVLIGPGQGWAAPGGGPVLLAEIPDTVYSYSTTFPYDPSGTYPPPPYKVPSYARFDLGYPVTDVKPDLTASAYTIGPAQITKSECAYFDFKGTSNFTNLVRVLKDTKEEEIYWGIAFYTAGGEYIDLAGDVAQGYKSMAVPSLAGQTIDFVRLVVNDVTCDINGDEFNGGTVSWEYDVVWQFWSGSADAVPGGGQRSSVNSFLSFLNPLETSVTLLRRVEQYPMEVQYGPTVTGNRQVTLNGDDISGQFTPTKNGRQVVPITLAPGRNVLKLQVEGTVGTSTRTATDSDTITIINP